MIRHEATLRANPRLGPAVLGLARLNTVEREMILQQAAQWLETPGVEGENSDR